MACKTDLTPEELCAAAHITRQRSDEVKLEIQGGKVSWDLLWGWGLTSQSPLAFCSGIFSEVAVRPLFCEANADLVVWLSFLLL